MPELPEVETVARGLRAQGVEGARIADASVATPRTVEPSAPADFIRAVRGRVIASVARRAKYVVFRFREGGALLLHLRMTGRLHFAEPGTPRGPYDRLLLRFADGRTLVFHDTRRFGRCRVVADPDAELAHLGPEPLEDDFTPDALRRALQGRRRQLKPLLLDQSVVAGLGNIYVDEALWEAKLHPEQPADALGPAAIRRLHAAIRTVLQRGLDAQGTTLGRGSTNFYSVAGRRGNNDANLRVFRRDGLPCPRCGTLLARCVVGQRGTHLCPRCQRMPSTPTRRPRAASHR
jgi:formamidopyrimidine-DNA glycosylase